MRIFAKTMDGTQVAFEVDKNKTIADVKKKIQEKTGLYAIRQKLVFQGAYLQDDKTIGYYQIADQSVINVVAGIRGSWEIFAKTLDRKTCSLLVWPPDTIADVKRQIQGEIGLHPDEQKLVFRGDILEDDKTVDHYQIWEKSVLNVVARLRHYNMQIFAKTMDGKIYPLLVLIKATIADVKKKIREEIGLRLDEQFLVFEGDILEDDKTVDHYQIAPESVINVVLRRRSDSMQIFSKTMDGKTYSIWVLTTDTIADVKRKIQDKISLSPDEQKLVFLGGVLEDDKAVHHYPIADQSVINVVALLRGAMRIFAKTKDEKMVSIEVMKYETISDVKKKIQDEIGLSPDEQRIKFQGRILRDDQDTVQDCQIPDRSVINVFRYCFEGFIEFIKTGDVEMTTIHCQDEWIDKEDVNGWRPIHWACANGHADIVHFLLSRDSKIDVRTKVGETPLDLARMRRNNECVRIIENAQKLLKIFADVRKDNLKTFQESVLPLWTKEPKTGQTLLDAIMEANAKSIIKFIKRTPVTDNTMINFLSLKRDRFTDQSYALLCQWFVQCCIRHNIDWAFLRLCCADVVNSGPLPDGTTCLDTAVEHRRSLCVRHILHKHVTSDETWRRATNAAVKKRYKEIVDLIEHRQMELKRNASMGRNRLHLAVVECDLDMVEYLLRKGLVDHSHGNEVGDTPLMMAIANRKDECAEVIRQYGANVDVVNKHGQTALHAAVSGKMDVLPQWLIDERLCLEQRDCMDLTALQQAVEADLEAVVTQLVAIGADHRSPIQADIMTFCTKQWCLPLTKKENVASLCLKLHRRLYPSVLHKFNYNDMDFTDANGDTLLHLAARLTNVYCCKELINKGAHIGKRNKMGRTPLLELLYHIERKDMDVTDGVIYTVRCLIDHGADIEDEDGTGRTALQITIGLVSADVERLMMEMVKKRPTVSKLSPDDLNILLHGKFCRFLQILPLIQQTLVEKLISVDVMRQSITTLQQSTTKILFRYAGVAVKNAFVDEMLKDAACKDDEDYFNHLLQSHRADWTVMDNGETILTALLKETNLKFCRLLLNMRNASILIQLNNRNGDSPLMLAIEKGMDELMDELILETKSLDNQNSGGLSALSLLFRKVSVANKKRQVRLSIWIKHLISKSADIHKVNKHGQAAISFCTDGVLRDDFKLFFNRQHRDEVSQTRGAAAAVQGQAASVLHECTVCLDRERNCTLPCGHTFCMDCVEGLDKCPNCRATDMTMTRIFLN